ncbi:MAG: NAD(+) synthase, partial [Oscillospiraceae bacterium]
MGDIVFVNRDNEDFGISFEICEDLWVAAPPGVKLAQNGATVILNASCSDETVGKAEYRRNMIESYSGRLLCAY